MWSSGMWWVESKAARVSRVLSSPVRFCDSSLFSKDRWSSSEKNCGAHFVKNRNSIRLSIYHNAYKYEEA